MGKPPNVCWAPVDPIIRAYLKSHDLSVETLFTAEHLNGLYTELADSSPEVFLRNGGEEERILKVRLTRRLSKIMNITTHETNIVEMSMTSIDTNDQRMEDGLKQAIKDRASSIQSIASSATSDPFNLSLSDDGLPQDDPIDVFAASGQASEVMDQRQGQEALKAKAEETGSAEASVQHMKAGQHGQRSPGSRKGKGVEVRNTKGNAEFPGVLPFDPLHPFSPPPDDTRRLRHETLFRRPAETALRQEQIGCALLPKMDGAERDTNERLTPTAEADAEMKSAEEDERRIEETAGGRYRNAALASSQVTGTSAVELGRGDVAAVSFNHERSSQVSVADQPREKLDDDDLTGPPEAFYLNEPIMRSGSFHAIAPPTSGRGITSPRALEANANVTADPALSRPQCSRLTPDDLRDLISQEATEDQHARLTPLANHGNIPRGRLRIQVLTFDDGHLLIEKVEGMSLEE